MVDVSAAINVYKNLKCSPDINIAISLQKKKILENWVWCKVPFEASVARQKITGSSYICRALPEWNWGQLQSQSDKRGAEIVADSNHQYFSNSDDRNWGSKCADSPKNRQNERFFGHHLIRGEVTWLFAIRSPAQAGRKSMKDFRLDIRTMARDSIWLWPRVDDEIQDVECFKMSKMLM